LATLYTNRAQARLKDGQLRPCVEDCGKALELDPQNYKAFQRRADANEQREKYKDAAADFAEVARIKPDNALARTGYLRVTRAAKALDPTYKSVSLSLLVPMSPPRATSTTPMVATVPEQSPAPPSQPEKAATLPGASALAATAASTQAANGTAQHSPTSVATTVKCGTRVVLKGLSKVELNGSHGVAGEVQENGRQVISLDGGKQLALKPTNFEAVSAEPTPTGPPKAAAKSNGWAEKSTRDPTPTPTPTPTPPVSAPKPSAAAPPDRQPEEKSTRPPPQATESAKATPNTAPVRPPRASRAAPAKDGGERACEVSAVLKELDAKGADGRTILQAFDKETLISVILELRQTTADVNGYMTELIEKVMAKCPEALQTP
jgi:hypothetical protein